jgi:hypothetical protein
VAADVSLPAKPTNPADGEQVSLVQVLPIDEAIAFMAAFDDGPLIDVIKLTQKLNLVATYRRVRLREPAGITDLDAIKNNQFLTRANSHTGGG